MELLLMVNAARGASAAQITAVIPHYAYARSDKKDASRISLGGRLVADLLVTAGVDRVLTMNLHAPQVHGFFSVPVDHLTALGVIADHYRGRDLSNHVVVSPDLGNAKQATLLARLLGLPVAAGNKQRLADDKVVISSVVGDVAGKKAIVLDDEIATGGSIVEIVSRLRVRRGLHRLHPRPVRRLGGGTSHLRHPHLGGGLHQHRPRTRELPGPEGAERRVAVRGGHRPHPQRQLGLDTVQRGRSRLRPTPGTRGPVLNPMINFGRPII